MASRNEWTSRYPTTERRGKNIYHEISCPDCSERRFVRSDQLTEHGGAFACKRCVVKPAKLSKWTTQFPVTKAQGKHTLHQISCPDCSEQRFVRSDQLTEHGGAFACQSCATRRRRLDKNQWISRFPNMELRGDHYYHEIPCPDCSQLRFVRSSELTARGGVFACRSCMVKRRCNAHDQKKVRMEALRLDTDGSPLEQCKQCGTKWTNESIHKNSFKLGERGFAMCRDCVKAQKKQHRNKETEAKYAKESREFAWEKWLLRGARRKRKTGSPTVTIDEQWIRDQYAKQGGRCYWTDVKLIPSSEARNPFKPSLDRIDSTQPYSSDNTVIATLAANIGRNENSVDDWENFLRLVASCC